MTQADRPRHLCLNRCCLNAPRMNCGLFRPSLQDSDWSVGAEFGIADGGCAIENKSTTELADHSRFRSPSNIDSRSSTVTDLIFLAYIHLLIAASNHPALKSASLQGEQFSLRPQDTKPRSPPHHPSPPEPDRPPPVQTPGTKDAAYSASIETLDGTDRPQKMDDSATQ
jgi:hypothetical protein